MAIRTDASAVLAILDTDLTTTQIDAFIATASLIVDGELGTSGLSVAVLTDIETWLAAHLCTTRDPRLKSVKIGSVAETYVRDGETSPYLDGAIALDPTGSIADALIARKTKGRVKFRTSTSFADEANADVSV